jgi:hypothetical protein
LQYWVGPDAYNSYAYFLKTGSGELIWIVRAVLLVCIILHIISAIYLRIYNNKAKPVGYQMKNYVKSKVTSRTMLWTGLLLAFGITFHLLHFTAGVVDAENGFNKEELHPTGSYATMGGPIGEALAVADMGQCPSTGACCATTEIVACSADQAQCCSNTGAACKSNAGQQCCKTDASQPCCKDGASQQCCKADASKASCCGTCAGEVIYTAYDPAAPGEVIKVRHDAYGMVTAEFGNIWVVLCYVAFMLLVGFHLNHAIQSGLQTIGVQGPKFSPCMRIAGTVLTVVLIALFLILPIGIQALKLMGCTLGGC